jgi:hypothetical protein
MRLSMIIGLGLLLLAGGLSAQDEKFKSGPQIGEVLPGPFDAFILNGKRAKGRQHCLVCEYGLHPAVMVFAREPADGADGPMTALLGKLDEAVGRYEDDHYLGGCAVFLSPDARDSSNNPDEQDPKKLVEEAIARQALAKRLEARAEKLKNVVIAFFPAEGPKGYQINPKAEVTVLFYVKHKVLANYAYEEGKMTDTDVDQIIKTVDAAFAKKKRAK